MTLPTIPILRFGKPYESLDTTTLRDPRNGNPIANIGMANAGLVRRDVRKAVDAADVLRAIPSQTYFNICSKAAEHFMSDDLELAPGLTQSPQQYVEQLSTTSGLPHVLCRRNMGKIQTVMQSMETIVRGLTRGLSNTVLDDGMGEHDGVPVCYHATTDALGVVLPSNSPGVNSIWLPSVALKTPVILKPGREEPWTPLRMIAAMVKAGCPREAFGFYPTDHEGADAIMTNCGRAIIFGDDKTLKRYAGNPAINLHGTGRSKVLIGEDVIDDWESLLDLLVSSIAENGGRSCINASCIMVPRHGDAIADALAQHLAKIEPRPADDEQSQLSAFANPAFAEYIDGAIEDGLQTPGAEDITARYRTDVRKTTLDDWTFLRPTLIRCQAMDHPLANTEFLFPFASVVEVPQDQMLDQIGHSLVVSAITEDKQFIDSLLACPLIDRLNIGRMPTCRVDWDQPHEGNLFEFLYRRRAIAYA